MLEYCLRFLAGGIAVSAFAALGDTLRPKSFAGLFGAATSVALPILTLAFWKFELETARKYSDGIVLWGTNTYLWNDKSGWWGATVDFAESLKNSSGAPAKK